MKGTVVLSVLNAKHVHASPAPWCLAAGVKTYAPELYNQVRVVEATINKPTANVLQDIVDLQPAIVGFSCYLWNIKTTLELCTALKQALPQVIIVLGGPEVSYCAKDILQKNPQIDYILSGEGEESVPAFLKAIFAQEENETLSEEARQSIAGLCGRNADGTIYESEPSVLTGAVPSPLIAGYAEALQGRIAYFETSRGCPYTCAFCLSGRCGKPRYFTGDRIFEDLLRLANSGTRTIKFIDRTFNAHPVHANKILKFILNYYGKEIPSGVCFHFEIAGDILKEETFVLLEQMPVGAVQLEIGMQSFYEKTLEAVNRKTDTTILQANIRRLVAMGNMHIHIDLIAGLPYEGLTEFAESFNKGYRLGAHVLQLGFLKLLHGSPMRSQPQIYPCEFDENAPYEVRTTPWLSTEDLALLHQIEDALERVYNSGRFSLTVDYVLNASGLLPFEFYAGLGLFSHKAGVHLGISLDDYTRIVQDYCATLPNIEKETLRDFLVRDRLATNSTGRLPSCLYRPDPELSKAIRSLGANPSTVPQKGVRRGVALLYAAQAVCWVDYVPTEKNPVTGRWVLHEIPLETLV